MKQNLPKNGGGWKEFGGSQSSFQRNHDGQSNFENHQSQHREDEPHQSYSSNHPANDSFDEGAAEPEFTAGQNIQKPFKNFKDNFYENQKQYEEGQIKAEKNKKQKVRNYGFGDPDADQNEAESGKNSNSQLSAAIVSENKMTVHPER